MNLEERIRDGLHDLAADETPLPAVEAIVSRARRQTVRRAAVVSTVAVGAVVAAALLVNDLAPSPIEIIDQPTEDEDVPAAEAGWRTIAEPELGQRARHGAVWTGSELIVWGGADPNGPPESHDDGGAYDPAADRWRTLAPSPSSAHMDVHMHWTGSEVIIWGGRPAGRTSSIDGALYDPDRDSWRVMADPGLPTGAGFDASMLDGVGAQTVWTGSELLAVTTTGENPAVAYAYDPDRDRWDELASLPVELTRLDTAVWTGTDLLIWGRDAGGQAALLAYTPDTDVWRRLADAPLSPRARPVAVWTGTELLIWGGADTDLSGDLDDGAAYDPGTDTWRELPEAPIAARNFAAAVWAGDRLVIWGGADTETGSEFRARNDGAAYHPDTESWERLPDGPLDGRAYSTATWTGTDLLIWGGSANGHHRTPLGASYLPD